MSARDGLGGGDGPVSMDVDVEGDRTLITVSGQRNAAVVVYSESGERIYLPPEEDDHDADDPYNPAASDDPYQGTGPTETPYGPTRQTDPEVGMNDTADGFQILHPEPVDDLRLVR